MKVMQIILSLTFIILLFSSCGESKDSERPDDIPSIHELEEGFIDDEPTGMEESYLGGTYEAKNCDLTILITPAEKENDYNYSVIVKGKEVSGGTTKIDELPPSTVSLGKIEALFDNENLVIQNYGNAMNEFEHFNICEDKFIELEFMGQG